MGEHASDEAMRELRKRAEAFARNSIVTKATARLIEQVLLEAHAQLAAGAAIVEPVETAPREGSFLALWRSKKMEPRWSILVWRGKSLWTDSGVAVNELDVSFSHWARLPAVHT